MKNVYISFMYGLHIGHSHITVSVLECECEPCKMWMFQAFFTRCRIACMSFFHISPSYMRLMERAYIEISIYFAILFTYCRSIRWSWEIKAFSSADIGRREEPVLSHGIYDLITYATPKLDSKQWNSIFHKKKLEKKFWERSGTDLNPIWREKNWSEKF